MPLMTKGEIVGFMTQLLSLMATNSDDRSQFSRLTTQCSDQNSQDEEREVYAGSPLAKLCIHAGFMYTSSIYVHTNFHRMQGTYILEN